ncbi:MAG TPA: hypothetical protein VH250_01110, partial [Granulicella sp.]|nr:hypothetical protein [Granulicella sp.]
RGSCGTPVSEAQIASRARPPVRSSVVRPVLLLVMLWLFLGVPIVSVMVTALRTAISHAHAATVPLPPDSLPPAQPPSVARTLVSFAPPVLVLLGVSGYLAWRVIAARRFNRTAYPRLLAQWQASLICKVCGAVFRPSDGEAGAPLGETPEQGLP